MPEDSAFAASSAPLVGEEGASPGTKLELTVGMTPALFPGDKGPRESVRIGQAEALDLTAVQAAVSPNVFFKTKLNGKTWGAVVVLSSYTNVFQAMLMATDDNVYNPGPEWIGDSEGDGVMKLAASVLAEAEQQSGGGTVCIGYNWSPLGFGELEGKAGLQSIPTKFHPQIWAWWPFPDPGYSMQHNIFRAEWVQ